MAEYSSRFEAVKAAIYPIVKKQDYYEAIQGTVDGWSPNNLRRIFIGENYVLLEWYMKPAISDKTYTRGKIAIDGIQGCKLQYFDLTAPTQRELRGVQQGTGQQSSPSVIGLLFGLHGGRKFQNLEEVIFIGDSNNPIFVRDLAEWSIVEGKQVSTYLRLVSVAFLGMNQQEFIKAYRGMANDKENADTFICEYEGFRSSIKPLYVTTKEKEDILGSIGTRAPGEKSSGDNKGFYSMDNSLREFLTKRKQGYAAKQQAIEADKNKLSEHGVAVLYKGLTQSAIDYRRTISILGTAWNIIVSNKANIDSRWGSKVSIVQALNIARKVVKQRSGKDLSECTIDIKATEADYQKYGLTVSITDSNIAEFLNALLLCGVRAGISFKDVSDKNIEELAEATCSIISTALFAVIMIMTEYITADNMQYIDTTTWLVLQYVTRGVLEKVSKTDAEYLRAVWEEQKSKLKAAVGDIAGNVLSKEQADIIGLKEDFKFIPCTVYIYKKQLLGLYWVAQQAQLLYKQKVHKLTMTDILTVMKKPALNLGQDTYADVIKSLNTAYHNLIDTPPDTFSRGILTKAYINEVLTEAADSVQITYRGSYKEGQELRLVPTKEESKTLTDYEQGQVKSFLEILEYLMSLTQLGTELLDATNFEDMLTDLIKVCKFGIFVLTSVVCKLNITDLYMLTSTEVTILQRVIAAGFTKPAYAGVHEKFKNKWASISDIIESRVAGQSAVSYVYFHIGENSKALLPDKFVSRMYDIYEAAKNKKHLTYSGIKEVIGKTLPSVRTTIADYIEILLQQAYPIASENILNSNIIATGKGTDFVKKIFNKAFVDIGDKYGAIRYKEIAETTVNVVPKEFVNRDNVTDDTVNQFVLNLAIMESLCQVGVVELSDENLEAATLRLTAAVVLAIFYFAGFPHFFDYYNFTEVPTDCIEFVRGILSSQMMTEHMNADTLGICTQSFNNTLKVFKELPSSENIWSYAMRINSQSGEIEERKVLPNEMILNVQMKLPTVNVLQEYTDYYKKADDTVQSLLSDADVLHKEVASKYGEPDLLGNEQLLQFADVYLLASYLVIIYRFIYDPVEIFMDIRRRLVFGDKKVEIYHSVIELANRYLQRGIVGADCVKVLGIKAQADTKAMDELAQMLVFMQDEILPKLPTGFNEKVMGQ